jgi:hypothetical protein
MAHAKHFIVLALLLATTLSVQQYYSDYQDAITSKKGLTFEASVWPE